MSSDTETAQVRRSNRAKHQAAEPEHKISTATRKASDGNPSNIAEEKAKRMVFLRKLGIREGLLASCGKKMAQLRLIPSKGNFPPVLKVCNCSCCGETFRAEEWLTHTEEESGHTALDAITVPGTDGVTHSLRWCLGVGAKYNGALETALNWNELHPDDEDKPPPPTDQMPKSHKKQPAKEDTKLESSAAQPIKKSHKKKVLPSSGQTAEPIKKSHKKGAGKTTRPSAPANTQPPTDPMQVDLNEPRRTRSATQKPESKSPDSRRSADSEKSTAKPNETAKKEAGTGAKKPQGGTAGEKSGKKETEKSKPGETLKDDKNTENSVRRVSASRSGRNSESKIVGATGDSKKRSRFLSELWSETGLGVTCNGKFARLHVQRTRELIPHLKFVCSCCEKDFLSCDWQEHCGDESKDTPFDAILIVGERGVSYSLRWCLGVGAKYNGALETAVNWNELYKQADTPTSDEPPPTAKPSVPKPKTAPAKGQESSNGPLHSHSEAANSHFPDKTESNPPSKTQANQPVHVPAVIEIPDSDEEMNEIPNPEMPPADPPTAAPTKKPVKPRKLLVPKNREKRPAESKISINPETTVTGVDDTSAKMVITDGEKKNGNTEKTGNNITVDANNNRAKRAKSRSRTPDPPQPRPQNPNLQPSQAPPNLSSSSPTQPPAPTSTHPPTHPAPNNPTVTNINPPPPGNSASSNFGNSNTARGHRPPQAGDFTMMFRPGMLSWNPNQANFGAPRIPSASPFAYNPMPYPLNHPFPVPNARIPFPRPTFAPLPERLQRPAAPDKSG